MCHTLGTGSPYLRDVGSTRNIVDDEFGYLVDGFCNESVYTPSIQPQGPHVATLGMKIMINNTYLPELYQNGMIIAQHGSWNRAKFIGYRVAFVHLTGDNLDEIDGFTILADGWLNDDTQIYHGRPVDIELLPDGSIIVSDDYRSSVYRILYDP